ncbi:MAG: hypothetical protein MI862_03160 [Desulfobacterales bacterium]|nr:hypothetical protein [Desulfobacterales bacterium]
MKACTKCGNWHTTAEKKRGAYLSCTEVKSYWSAVGQRHKEDHGHFARIRIRKDGRVVCLKCMQDLEEIL